VLRLQAGGRLSRIDLNDQRLNRCAKQNIDDSGSCAIELTADIIR